MFEYCLCVQEYREAREEFSKCKAQRRQRDLELKQLKDRLKPYEDEKRQKEEAVEQCRLRVVSLRKKQTSLDHQVAQHRSKLQELEDQVEQPRQELKEKQKEEEGRLKKLEDFRKEIDGIERELSGLDDEIAQTQSEGSEGPNARLKEIHLNLLELKNNTEKSHEAMAQLEFEREGKQMDAYLGVCVVMESTLMSLLPPGLVAQLRRKKEEANRRLQYLQQQNRDTYEAIMWLRANQHRFQHPIIEPILLVVRPPCIYTHAHVASHGLPTRLPLHLTFPAATALDQLQIKEVYASSGECHSWQGHVLLCGSLQVGHALVYDRGSVACPKSVLCSMCVFMLPRASPCQVHDKMHLRVNGVTAPDKPPEAFRPELPFEQLRFVT